MKKLLSIILAVILLPSCAGFSANRGSQPLENPVDIYSDDSDLGLPYNLIWESAHSEHLNIERDEGRTQYYIELLCIDL